MIKKGIIQDMYSRLKSRFISFLALCLCVSSTFADWHQETHGIMGTQITIELWTDSSNDDAHAKRCINLVIAEMHRIDRQMSPFKEDSELSKINTHAADYPVKISSELFTLISRAQSLSVQSDGAFDITFASVAYAYDYRNKIKPSEQQIQENLKHIDYRFIVLDTDTQTIFFKQAGVRIDLGGIAKGHAVDNAIALLQDCGIKQALVSAGGDTRIIGDKGGRPWMTGIKDPRNKTQSIVAIPLSDTAISTSGDYERYFILDGQRYHHIISPDTGKSVVSTRSVTVLGPDATTTDGLSTTLFILGPAKAMEFVEKLEGIDAVIIDAKGRIHYSSGLQTP